MILKAFTILKLQVAQWQETLNETISVKFNHSEILFYRLVPAATAKHLLNELILSIDGLNIEDLLLFMTIP